MPLTHTLLGIMLVHVLNIVSLTGSFSSLNQRIHKLVQSQIFINCGHKSIDNVKLYVIIVLLYPHLSTRYDFEHSLLRSFIVVSVILLGLLNLQVASCLFLYALLIVMKSPY